MKDLRALLGPSALEELEASLAGAVAHLDEAVGLVLEHLQDAVHAGASYPEVAAGLSLTASLRNAIRDLSAVTA